MKTVKTTFEIEQRLHTRLKAMAGRLGVNARDLLVEGLELVLAKYDGESDRDELAARAQAARQRLRAGYFDGPADLSETYESRLLVAAEPPHKYGP
ncbi:MAG: ribbon-helix-helix domain-containing protein [Myxococcales bacterium]|nr:ribbon-helix-helix domain-containing protein [Myxococcales bacterium]